MPNRIMILCDISGSRIVPPHLPVGRGEHVSFCAIGSDVLVSFPGQTGQIVPDNFTITENTCVDVTIESGASLGTHCFYAYCVKTKRFAEAASAGELIVGP